MATTMTAPTMLNTSSDGVNVLFARGALVVSLGHLRIPFVTNQIAINFTVMR